ncbi:DNA (cytosine-5-)-methyltransferase [Halobellus inordinatus]|uniref:DNA (cytosine-5-)-methyltransferase n=1 Tax=Halobellus inordinatus TaxID=1126236 RepID=UPI002113A794|nr:DNA (cytosine-5-)-methyltransferase [Halobellus ramosii]
MSGPTAISLFSGLGGIDIGVHRAGIETLVTLDSDSYSADSLRANSSTYDEGIKGQSASYEWTVIEDDIHDVTAEELLEAAGTDDIDFIVGGPPCQTFSRSNEGNREGTDAARGMLFEEYARLLRKIEPRAFIFENVRGLASANNGEDFEIIKEEFAQSGYTINDDVLNAANFGVPQTRKRLFIIGFRGEEKPYFPEPTHVEAKNALTGKPSWVTAREALSDFDLDADLTEEGYENAVGGQYGYLLKNIPPGGNYQHFTERKYDPEKGEYVERDEDELDAKVFDWRSRHYNYLLKQDPDRPTWTLQAAPGTYVGPFHWRSRRYSFLEQMQLMDIPVDYEICGPPREIQRQIGNAVPPGLIEAVIRSLSDQLGLATSDYKEEASNATIRADGGDGSHDLDGTIEIESSRSPWRHAEDALIRIQKGEQVAVRGRGKNIARVIDVLELIRRRAENNVEVELEETVIDKPEGTKSDVLSALNAEIAPN